VLGLFFTVVWLFHFWGYYVDKVTAPTVRDERPVLDLTHIDKEIAAFPDDPALRLRRASERAMLEDRPGAMEDLERYRTLTHDALGYHITKARLLQFNFGDCAAAIAEYDAALPLAPTMRVPPKDFDNAPITATVGEIHGRRAECYQALGRTEAAIDAYSAAIQYDPKTGTWWRERGELLLRQGCRDILHSQTLPGGYVPRSTRLWGGERNRCAEDASP
jgi:tetratricopeptide (TPR) repeat protein